MDLKKAFLGVLMVLMLVSSVSAINKTVIFSTDNHYGNTEGDDDNPDQPSEDVGAWDDNEHYKDYLTQTANPDFIFNYGDIVSEGDKPQQWEWAISNFTYIEENSPANKVWSVPGNHDALMSDGTNNEYWGGHGGYFDGLNMTSSAYCVEFGNNAHCMLPHYQADLSAVSSTPFNPATSGFVKDFYIPQSHLNWYKEKQEEYCNEGKNVFVGFHTQPYHTTTRSGSDWFGIDTDVWRNTTARLESALGSSCGADAVFTGHLHSDSNDFYSSSSDYAGGSAVWGSFKDTDFIPDGTVMAHVGVINWEHGRDQMGDFPNLYKSKFVEGRDYIELESYDISDPSNPVKVGTTYNGTSTPKNDLRIPLSNEIQFSDTDSEVDSYSQAWDISKVKYNESKTTYWRWNGVKIDRANDWFISKWQYDSAKSFENFSVDWTESSQGCCSLSYEFASSNSIDSSYSQWYSDPSEVPAGKYWKVNTSVSTSSSVLIKDMELTASSSKGGIIPVDSGDPFYIVSGSSDSQPTDSSGRFSVSDSLSASWTVNATGEAGTSYNISIFANSSNPNVASVNSNNKVAEIVDPSVGVEITSPQNQTYSSSSVDLNVTSSEAVETWEYSLDGAANQTFTPNTSISGLSDRGHTLEVYATDSNGNTGSESVSFTVDTDQDPSVSLNLNSTLIVENETLQATVSATDDIEVSNVSLDWTSDGTYEETAQGSALTATRQFQDTGIYTATARATDNTGQEDTTTQTFEVQQDVSEANKTLITKCSEADGDDPFCHPDPDVYNLTDGENITAYDTTIEVITIVDGEDAGSAFEVNGSLVGIQEGEQVSQGNLNLNLAQVYNVSGTLTAELEVYNENTKNNVTFRDGFTIEDNTTLTMEVEPKVQSGTYQFFGFANATGEFNQYTESEVFDVTVTDPEQNQTNQVPNADFTVDLSNLDVDVDASGSTDSDGSIVNYRWDWTNDGNFEASGVTASHTYPSPGDYTIVLEVEDDEGATDTFEKTVSVTEDSGGEDSDGDEGGTDDPTAVTDGSSLTLRAPHRGARYGAQTLAINEGESTTITLGGEENTIEVLDVQSSQRAEVLINGVQREVSERDSFDLRRDSGAAYYILEETFVSDVVNSTTKTVYFGIERDPQPDTDVPIGYEYAINQSGQITLQYRKTGIGNDWQNASTETFTSSVNTTYDDYYQNLTSGIYEIRGILESNGNTSTTLPTGVYVGQVPYINITNPESGREFSELVNGEGGYTIPLEFRAGTVQNTSFGLYYARNNNIYAGSSNVQVNDPSGFVESFFERLGNLDYIADWFSYEWQNVDIVAPTDVIFTGSADITVPSSGTYTGYANASSNYSDVFEPWNATSIGVQVNIEPESIDNITDSEVIDTFNPDNGQIALPPGSDPSFNETVNGSSFENPQWRLIEPDQKAEIETPRLDELTVDFSMLMGYEGNSSVNKSLVVENPSNNTVEVNLNPSDSSYDDIPIDAEQWNGEWAEGQYDWWLNYEFDNSVIYSTENKTNGVASFTVDQDRGPRQSYRYFFDQLKETFADQLNTTKALAGVFLTLLIVGLVYVAVRYFSGDGMLAQLSGGTVYAALAWVMLPPQMLNLLVLLAIIFYVVGKFTLWVVG